MAAGRRTPNLLLSLLVLLAVTGLALLCIAVAAGLLRQAAQEAAARKRAQDNLKQIAAAIKNYHDAHGAPEKDGIQATPEASDGGFSEEAVRERAIRYKDEWLEENPDTAFEDAPVSKVEKTPEGWRVVFEAARSPAEAESESRPELHVYVDSQGRLVKVAPQTDGAAKKPEA